jgi:P27 family predicted phage terminase small subunit
MSGKNSQKALAKAARPIITCPEELGPAARAEWDRVMVELNAIGDINALDRAALAAYCVAYALYIEAVAGIQTFGVMIKSPNGYPQQSPYVSVANKQFEIMMRVCIGFRIYARKPRSAGKGHHDRVATVG